MLQKIHRTLQSPEEGGAGPTMGSIADTKTPPAGTEVKTEAPAPKPSDGETADTDSQIFEAIAGEDLGEVSEEDTPPLTPKAKSKQEAPKPPVAETPKVETPPAKTEPKVETPPKVEAPKSETPPKQNVKPPEDKTPPPAPETPEQLRERLKKERDNAIAELTKQYEIPEADQAALVTEPEKVLPRILAEAHARAVEHALRVAQAQFPLWLQAMQDQRRVAEEHANNFFKEWPELNKPEHHATVARVLQGYRAANPDAKPEDVIREGGVASIIALRLPIPERVARMHNAELPDATKPRTIPAAASSSGTPPAVKEKSDNPFTVIAEEDLSES